MGMQCNVFYETQSVHFQSNYSTPNSHTVMTIMAAGWPVCQTQTGLNASHNIPMMLLFLQPLSRSRGQCCGLGPLLGGTRDSWGRWVEDGAARASPTSEWSQFTVTVYTLPPGGLPWSQSCGAQGWSVTHYHEEWRIQNFIIMIFMCAEDFMTSVLFRF